MFSSIVVQRKLDKLLKKGVKLYPHTVAEVERMNASLEHVYFLNSELGEMEKQRELTPEEITWINNERLLCKVDFRYFLSRYCWIKNEEDRTVRMQLWTSQEIFLDIIGEMEEAGIAIMAIILKARQLGLSRIISLIILHSILFSANINSLIASSTEGKTGLLFGMIDFVLKRLPWWIFHEQFNQKFRRENKLFELLNGSAITMQNGAQTSGIARGTTPTVAHITELGEFEKVGIRDPGALIDSALLRAMHDSEYTRLFLESTAEGQNNWWHNKWKSAKADWPIGRSRLRPIFLPWFVGGLYPKEVWLRAHPIPGNYLEIMAPWAQEHAIMAEEYVRTSDYLTRRLGSTWRMPIEQIWFYECERGAAIKERKLNKFLQEMPANDDEAFQSTNISVFDTETITYYRDKSHTYPLLGAYGLRGPRDVLPERLQPPSILIDANRKPIDIKAAWGTGYPTNFTLVPLRFDGWSLESDAQGIDKIYLWEQPQDGEIYGLGVDTADGIDKDRSGLEIIRKGNVYGPAKQVGEFFSGKLNALDIAPFCLALGSYFSVRTGDASDDGRPRQPRMAIECKGNGDQAQLRLRMHGWHNFHPWLSRQSSDKEIDTNKFNKIGVFTDMNFRAGLIDLLVKMIRDMDIEICSPFMVNEMTSLEANDINQSIRANYGGHDDRLMALGFILVSLYRFDLSAIAGMSANTLALAQARARRGDTQRQYAKWAPGMQER